MKKIFFLFLAVGLLASGCAMPKIGAKQKTLNVEEAKTKVTEFINKNLVQPGSEVSIKEVTEDQGMYKVVVNTANGQEVNSYLTKDGKMFFPQVMNIEEVEKAQANSGKEETNTAAATTEIPKQDKAKVELFVMGFCPYGVQAEEAMAPVIDLLGSKADIQVRYIASIPGTDLSEIKSLHGTTEGMEDVHQLCVAKNYDQKTLWKYIAEVNKNCYPTYRQGEDVFNTCWKAAAKTAGADAAKIESCTKSEGVSLIKAEETAADTYGVSGSPTLIINGVKYNGGRTAENYKQAICNGFNEQPEECSKTLSATAAAASGGCE